MARRGGGAFSNSAKGTKFVANRSFNREKWITPANESGIDCT